MKSIVVFYSNKGSNRYLAHKIAERLGCEIEEIRPCINSFFLFLFNFNPGIRKLNHDIAAYDRVILIGPIWMGRFIPPLRSFTRRYRSKIGELAFVTCCGSTYEKKNEKFGHGLVFEKVRSMMKEKLVLTYALPVGLLLPLENREDPDAFMKSHLNESNFNGEILERYEELMGMMEEQPSV